MKNYKLVLSYEGTRYRGWQRQGNTSGSLQEKLETLLSRMLEQQVELKGKPVSKPLRDNYFSEAVVSM